jgi:hypothetical protein
MSILSVPTGKQQFAITEINLLTLFEKIIPV